MAQRLPTVGGDSGNWGSVLNGYLGIAHNADGTLKLFTNAKDYGMTGDGVTDDTAAFIAALTGIGAGGTLYIPDGTYILSQAFTWPALLNQHVICSQNAIIKQKATAGNDAFIKFQNAGTIWTGGIIDGNVANCPNTFANMWVIGTADNSVIENVRVQNFTGDGIRESRSYVTIRGCTITGGASSGSGINIAQQNLAIAVGVKVHDNIITQTRNSSAAIGINLTGTNGGNQINGTIMSNNQIVLPSVTAGFGIQNWDNCNESLIIGNYISGGNAGISIADSDKVKVVGNHVANPNPTGLCAIEIGGNDCVCSNNYIETSPTGVLLDGAKTGSIVTNNNFNGCKTGISVASSTQSHVNISGNIFDNCGNGGGTYDISIAGNSYFNISGNVMWGTKGVGSIGTGGGSNINITGNELNYGSGGGCGVRVEGAGDYVQITGNMILGYTAGAGAILVTVSPPTHYNATNNLTS